MLVHVILHGIICNKTFYYVLFYMEDVIIITPAYYFDQFLLIKPSHYLRIDSTNPNVRIYISTDFLAQQQLFFFCNLIKR